MTKTVIETAPYLEMSNHLGYAKQELVGNRRNSKDGKRPKTLLTLGGHALGASPSVGMSCWPLMVPGLRFSVGVQLGLSTTVWGFKSGKDIDECEYPQVRDSNKCPEGDLPTRDTRLQNLAPDLAAVSLGA